VRQIFIIALVLMLASLPAVTFAAEAAATSAAELATANSGLDGADVVLEGEVISEQLAGGDGHVWVNVLSDGVGIGVWAPLALAQEIQVLGDWAHTGDMIRVTGRFSEACDTHGGDLDVHATDIELLQRGSDRQHPVAYWKLAFAFSGVLVAALAYRRMRRTEEESLRG
jgi:hypothetical protein